MKKVSAISADAVPLETNPDTHAPILAPGEDRAITQDSLENLVAGLGTDKDKRAHSTFKNDKNLSRKGNEHELNAMYRTDWLVGKVVDIIPEDSTREWRKFNGSVTPDQIKSLEDEEKRLGLQHAVMTAMKWARLYGTAFIVMSVDDGQPPNRPLDINKIKPGSLRHIKVADRHRINHAQQQPVVDPLDPNYGMPQFYRFNETSTVIHHSRMIRFDAVELPFDEFRRQNYFSDGVVDRLYESVTNFNTTTASAASMVYETNVDIYKIDGLMDYLQTPEGTSLIKKRFALSGMFKSFMNAQIIDSKEDWMNKTNGFSGLPELIEKFSQLLSAATDIPATRLLGVSSSGFNATGEGDLKNYYDMVRSKQNSKLRPKLDHFDRIMAANIGISNGEDLQYEFVPLFQPDPKEKAEIRFVNAQADALYVDRQILSEVIVAKGLQEDNVYTNIDSGWIRELEDVEGFDEPEEESDAPSTRPQRLLEEETAENAAASSKSSKTKSSATGKIQ